MTNPEYITPPEIMRLYDYFEWTRPSYLYKTDSDQDRTRISWFKIKGNDVEQSVKEYIAFKPKKDKYESYDLDNYAWMMLRNIDKYQTDFTYFIVDSSDQIPSEKAAFERLKELCLNNAIRIVILLHEGTYYEYLEDKYYRLEVYEEWPGSADDAATYGAFHIYEISKNEAL